MRAVFQFFADNWPRPVEVLLGGPPALAWAAACLVVAARLKTRRGWKTGYTRKVFHFLIFFTAAGLQAAVGTRTVCLFGAAASAVVFFAVWCGDGYPGYEALAREKDAPHRTAYILVPWLATFLGGVGANALFGPAALCGYLAAGFGDAVGEPVGTRFGRHRYPVPARRGVRAERSLEGSAAVFAATALAAAAASLVIAPALGPAARWGAAALIGAAGMLVEAVSPHGWDNLAMQLVPAGLAAWAWGGGPGS